VGGEHVGAEVEPEPGAVAGEEPVVHVGRGARDGEPAHAHPHGLVAVHAQGLELRQRLDELLGAARAGAGHGVDDALGLRRDLTPAGCGAAAAAVADRRMRAGARAHPRGQGRPARDRVRAHRRRGVGDGRGGRLARTERGQLGQGRGSEDPGGEHAGSGRGSEQGAVGATHRRCPFATSPADSSPGEEPALGHRPASAGVGRFVRFVYRQSPDRRRATRSAVAGCVVKRFLNCTSRPVSGLTM
jgi:hypothetical protein